MAKYFKKTEIFFLIFKNLAFLPFPRNISKTVDGSGKLHLKEW